jgi:hypothetical protein
MFYSILTGLAVTTLVATAALFVVQAFEDFRDA